MRNGTISRHGVQHQWHQSIDIVSHRERAWATFCDLGRRGVGSISLNLLDSGTVRGEPKVQLGLKVVLRFTLTVPGLLRRPHDLPEGFPQFTDPARAWMNMLY